MHLSRIPCIFRIVPHIELHDLLSGDAALSVSSFQRHQFFRTGWMDGDAGIEIPLLRPHLHGHPEPLHHLRAALTQDVQAHDPLLLPFAYQLVLGRIELLLLGGVEVVEHGGELRMVDLDVLPAIFLRRLRFRHPYRSHFRMCKNHRRYEVVVELRVRQVRAPLGVLGAEYTVAERPAGGDGDGCQFRLAGDVAEGIEALDGGVLVLVDHDVPFRSQLDAHTLRFQPFDFRRAPDGPEKLVDLELVAVLFDQLEGFLAWRAVLDSDHLLEALVGLVDDDASFFVPLRQRLLDHRVEVAQEGVAPDEHVHFDIECTHDSCQLHCDVACANEGHLLGQLLDIEEAVTVDAELGARNVLRFDRMSSGCNEDMWSGVGGLAAIRQLDLELVDVFERGRASDEVNSFTLPIPLVSPIETCDVRVSLLLEFGKVELDVLGDVISIVCAILQYFVNGGEVSCDLFRDTADRMLAVLPITKHSIYPAPTHPTLTQVPPDRALSMMSVFAPYQPDALLAAPLPPLPPPMTMKS